MVYNVVAESGRHTTKHVIMFQGARLTLSQLSATVGHTVEVLKDHIEREFYGGIGREDEIGFINQLDANRFAARMNLR